MENFYQRVLNIEDYQLNENFLKKVHEIAFLSATLDMKCGTIDPKITEFFESSKIEALRGLAVAVIIAVLLQRHGFFIGSFTTNSSSPSYSDPLTSELYDRVRIYDDFRAWTNIYDPDNFIQNEFTEYARLVRFYHINRIIFSLFEKGSRLKGMYLFVGACLEGIPDGIGRLYVIGGHMTESTQRRESIFETITGVPKGRRNLIPK